MKNIVVIALLFAAVAVGSSYAFTMATHLLLRLFGI
jgi:hypothetical protein